MDITQLLLKTQDGSNAAEMNQAQETLTQLHEQNPAMFLVALAAELGDEKKPELSRQVAGLMLKNAMYSDTPEKKELLAQQWLTAVPVESREQIKTAVFGTLRSNSYDSRHTASLVIGKIASIEVPQHLWDGLIPALLECLSTSPSSELKHATLEAFGYICEEVAPEALEAHSQKILLAVMEGMSPSETNPEVKLAAVTALDDSLQFVEKHMEVQNERDYIIQMLLETCKWPVSEKVRQKSFQCFVKIASMYYNILSSYIQMIYAATVEAIQKEVDTVSLQAIEFWTTVAEVETELNILYEQEGDQLEEQFRSNHFIENAWPYLAEEILKALTNQEEDQDELSTWNPSMAAGCLLRAIAEAIGDAVVQPVVPFIEANIVSQDWRQKEAASIALGSIVDGPQEDIVAEYLLKFVPYVTHHMKDPEDLVRDTASWTLGRLCKFVPRSMEAHSQAVIESSIVSLQDEHERVVANAAWILLNLAEWQGNEVNQDRDLLGEYFQNMLAALLVTAENCTSPDALGSLYGAINALVQNSSETEANLIISLIPVTSENLKKSFATQPLSVEESETRITTQTLILSVLHTIVDKLAEAIEPHAPDLIELLLHVLSLKDSRLTIEALFTLGSIADGIGPSFEPTLPRVLGIVAAGLKTYDEVVLVSVCVAVVGDFARALGARMNEYCIPLMEGLLEGLASNDLDKDVKPDIVSCLGDVALAIEGGFDRFLEITMNVLQQAASFDFNYDDEDMAEYANRLHEAIFGVFTAILHGLFGSKKASLFLPYAEPVLNFALYVVHDGHHTAGCLAAAVNVIGDITHACGLHVKLLVTQQSVRNMIFDLLKHPDPSVVESAKWTQKVLRKL